MYRIIYKNGLHLVYTAGGQSQVQCHHGNSYFAIGKHGLPSVFFNWLPTAVCRRGGCVLLISIPLPGQLPELLLLLKVLPLHVAAVAWARNQVVAICGHCATLQLPFHLYPLQETFNALMDLKSFRIQLQASICQVHKEHEYIMDVYLAPGLRTDGIA